MSISNNYNLPLPLYKALSKERYAPIAGRLSATALIDAPLVRVLMMKHVKEIEEDASERMWAMLGTAIHWVIEQNGSKEASEAKRICKHKSGATLVCIGDFYENQILTDWKVTSTWSWLLGGKSTWEKQLNVVKYIYELNEMPVKEMYVYAILRDWVKSKSYDRDYPDIPFQGVKIPIWEPEKLEKYIDERVEAHLFAESLIDSIGNVPICTPEERWQRPDTYAVKREGIKRAVRVFDTNDEAEKFMEKAKAKDLFIENRKGSEIRCNSFCSVNRFCEYFKSLPNVGSEE